MNSISQPKRLSVGIEERRKPSAPRVYCLKWRVPSRMISATAMDASTK
jgi:hypothetical protein